MIRFHPLRKDAATREAHAEVTLHPEKFIMPYFVVEGKNKRIPVDGFDGVERLSPDILVQEVTTLVAQGVSRIMLFGVIAEHLKDDQGSYGLNPDNPLCEAIRQLRLQVPEAIIITDVCLCPYTGHGHCGVLNGHLIDNDRTLPLLARMAVEHAKAGAQWVAPSAMMDGQVDTIRQALDAEGFRDVKIMGYSAKFSSALYGPFREAAGSTPAFGDRKTYQMDYRTWQQPLDEIAADLHEGAAAVMVKPAGMYLDIIARARQQLPQAHIAAYQVSGEYMMLKQATKAGLAEEAQIVRESLYAIARSGADSIISYFTKDIDRYLK